MKTDELVFIDTNVFAYAIDSESNFHKKAKDLVDAVDEEKIKGCFSPQVIGELYATLTNPNRLKKPLTPREATVIVVSLLEAETFIKIHVKESTIKLAIELAGDLGLRRGDFFDAQIAATMIDNGVNKIYTFNERHFKRFRFLDVMGLS